ncbi:MAG TPA: TldD/PmbA family protein [Chthonomonadales bacterium]|nr:TldD/PmbA family protein [Chthonomonadales bacterium]
MTENEAHGLLERALGHATADHTELMLAGTAEGTTRYANSAITQNIARTDAVLTVRSAFGQRVGSVRVNRLEPEAVEAAVRKAEGIARVAEPDGERMPPIEPCAMPHVTASDAAVASASPDDRADVVRAAIERVASADLTAAGSYATDCGWVAFANSRGHRAWHEGTSARLVCTAIGPDSSGWAEHTSWKRSGIDPKAAAERAAAKAAAARAPEAIEPGNYTVILEPAAVAEFLAFMLWSLDAKAADEGRSAFSGRLGQRIVGENITIESRAAHAERPGLPFASDGMPTPDVAWVRNGVLENLAHTRFWAAKTGRPYTGTPVNLLIPGGDASLEDLVASTGDGILVTRFWYIRFVDPMKLLLTGMTRDGLFRIRDGRICGGLKNMRFNESPLRALNRVVALGRPEVCGDYYGACVPPMKVESFAFTSGTEF